MELQEKMGIWDKTQLLEKRMDILQYNYNKERGVVHAEWKKLKSSLDVDDVYRVIIQKLSYSRHVPEKKNMKGYLSNDYSGFSSNGYDFYYGYEFGHDEDGSVWGFEVKKDDVSVFRRADRPEKYNWDMVTALTHNYINYIENKESK